MANFESFHKRFHTGIVSKNVRYLYFYFPKTIFILFFLFVVEQSCSHQECKLLFEKYDVNLVDVLPSSLSTLQRKDGGERTGDENAMITRSVIQRYNPPACSY